MPDTRTSPPSTPNTDAKRATPTHTEGGSAWAADTLTGHNSIIIIDNNSDANEISAACQQLLTEHARIGDSPKFRVVPAPSRGVPQHSRCGDRRVRRSRRPTIRRRGQDSPLLSRSHVALWDDHRSVVRTRNGQVHQPRPRTRRNPWSILRSIRGFLVVETGVDPVTLRFSGVCSAD